MIKIRIMGLALAAALAACQPRPLAVPIENKLVEPDAGATLPSLIALIEPNSAEAARQVVQRYGALLEVKAFDQAYVLWGGAGEASGMSRAQFAGSFFNDREIHAEVGKAGLTEGAAGSIYIKIPFRLHGTLNSGAKFNLVGPMTLRRVNDVDGSTAEQRRWHIASSELQPQP